jgi:hypothetical protein
MDEQKLKNTPPFPTMLRKMWSGGEVQQWLDENIVPLLAAVEPSDAAQVPATLTDEQRRAIEWAAGRAHVAALGKPIDGIEGQRWRVLSDLFRTASIAVAAAAPRLETMSEHIARDIQEGRFPKRSEPQTVEDSAAAAVAQPDERGAFVREVAAQLPERPDHWSACGQCERNSERAQDILDADAFPQAIGDAPDNAEPPRHIVDAAMDVARYEYGHGVTRASIIAIWKALGKPWYVPQATATQPAQTERALTDLVEKWERWQADGDKHGSPSTNGMSAAIRDMRALLTAAQPASGGDRG